MGTEWVGAGGTKRGGGVNFGEWVQIWEDWAEEFSDDADTQEAFIDGCMRALSFLTALELEAYLKEVA